MHPFFQQNPFIPTAASDIENDAELALHLVMFLLSTQNPDDGVWRAPHVGGTLRNTCHALEALHLLGLENSAGAMEAGIAWLVNLADVPEAAASDDDIIRLYPSRFKTLAWLDQFSNAQLIQDFESLDDYIDPHDGSIRGIMANQILATIIYADCLLYLDASTTLSKQARFHLEQALATIENHLRLWFDDRASNTRLSHFGPNDVGDLSYAFDVLFRAQRIAVDGDIGRLALETLKNAVSDSIGVDAITTDALYCTIQLATHFAADESAIRIAKSFIKHLRTRYQRQELYKAPLFFHPLVLRVLVTFYGRRLRAELTRLMLSKEKRRLELHRENLEQGLKDDFTNLIKSRFNVEILEIQRLTGGITSANLFRVNYALNLSPLDDMRRVQLTSPGSLVIKSGSLDSLQRSITSYQKLPAALKPYFARHAGQPQFLKAMSDSPCYLIMEDLANLSTFRDIIIRVDRGILSNRQKTQLKQASDIICQQLFAIYNATRRDESSFFGTQLSRLYLSDIETSLIRMSQPDKFAHLKSWFRGFWLGHRKYPSIEYYLGKIESHKAKFKVPYLTLTHGDCHSRNIMLNDSLSEFKLVDIDHLTEDGDYLFDLARLIEDVAVFGFLLDDGYRHRLKKRQVEFPTDSTQPNVIENRVQYSTFSSEAVRLFQKHMLEHLQAHAEAIGDTYWQERLWLALATNLLALVSKQTHKAYAAVVYAEAIKIFDELVNYLEDNQPLNNIPFPGQHPGGVVEKRVGTGEITLPAWYRQNSMLTKIHREVMAINSTIKFKLASGGKVVRYYADQSAQPFVVIDFKKQPPSILLASEPTLLDDPHGLVQPRPSTSELQTLLRPDDLSNPAGVMYLIKQTYHRQSNED